MMYLKGIIYLGYMLITRIKGIKYSYLKKYKSNEEAERYIGGLFLEWAKFTVKIIGLEIEVEGKENIPKEACVFISNHTSILDVPVILTAVEKPMGFIAKKEIMKVPFLGYWLEKVHCVAIDRNNAREAVKSISKGVENIKSGFSMVIFPEGTRSKEGNVGEFKKGSFKLATRAKAKIVPVSIYGANNGFEANKKFKAAKVKIVFGKAVDTTELDKEREKNLVNDIREEVILNLKK